MSISPIIRGAIIERYKRTCQYCGRSTDSILIGPDDTAWHMDHRIPKAKGGTDDESNLTLACAACNGKKHVALPDSDWFSRTARRFVPTPRTRFEKASFALRYARGPWAEMDMVDLGHLAGDLYIRVRDIRRLVEVEKIPYRVEPGGSWHIHPKRAEKIIAQVSGFTIEELELNTFPVRVAS